MATKQGNPAPGKNSYKYRQQFGIVVICRDEKHQEATFKALRSQGHTLKVVTV